MAWCDRWDTSTTAREATMPHLHRLVVNDGLCDRLAPLRCYLQH